jgi:hypothetical protein
MTRLREDEHDNAPASIPPPETEAEKKAEATAAYEGPSLAATLLVRMGLMTPEEAQAQFDKHALDEARLNPIADLLARAHTTVEIGQASQTIAQLLVAGRLQPQQARTALYAMQIALTAAHVADAASRKTEDTNWKRKTKAADDLRKDNAREDRNRATRAASAKLTKKRPPLTRKPTRPKGA